MTRSTADRRPRSAATSRPRASRERQRQRLIDACISALHVHGPSNTTVEKVVAIARMSPGIVRFYFESKAAMLVASLEYLAAEFEDQLLVPVALLRATPVAALERLVELYLGPEIASARKVSVWYSFWGEASSRQEYFDICGTRDERFEVLVRDLVGNLVEESRSRHLDADAIALGLIGVLEMLWQSYAFQTESTIDRAAARRRCMAYLRSVFPRQFPERTATRAGRELPAAAYSNAAVFEAERTEIFRGSWQFVGLEHELAAPGDFLTLEVPGTRALIVRQSDGALRAFHNACRHRPHALAAARAGHLESAIECPLHGLAYTLAGDPIGATPGGALRELPLTTAGDLLFVRAPTEDGDESATPAPLAARTASALALAPLPGPVELAATADWKLLVEHWLDGPEADVVARGEYGGEVSDGTSWSGHRYRSVLKGDPPARWQRSLIAPNQLIEIWPGRVEVLQVLPVAPGRSILRVYAYRPLARERSAPAIAFLAARLARSRHAASVALAESVQTGLETPAPPAEPVSDVPLPLAEFRIKIARLLPAALQPPGDPP